MEDRSRVNEYERSLGKVHSLEHEIDKSQISHLAMAHACDGLHTLAATPLIGSDDHACVMYCSDDQISDQILSLNSLQLMDSACGFYKLTL